MSDAFKAWRESRNPLRIGGPLDELLEKAFQAGWDALVEDIQTSMRKIGFLIQEKIERTIWISRDEDADQTEFRKMKPRKHAEGYYGTRRDLDCEFGWLDMNDLEQVPSAVFLLSEELKPEELKRAVLINGTWELREADGA